MTRLVVVALFIVAIDVSFSIASPVVSAGARSDDDADRSISRRSKREVLRLRYKDCGKSNRAIQFEKLSLKPIPIEIPGFLDVRIIANITRPLPDAVDVSMILKKKYFDSVWWRLPCVQDYGSCSYKDLDTCILTQDVFGCPVRHGYHNINQKFLVPDPGDDLLMQMLEGEYKTIVRVRDPKTRKELACLMAHFSLKT